MVCAANWALPVSMVLLWRTRRLLLPWYRSMITDAQLRRDTEGFCDNAYPSNSLYPQIIPKMGSHWRELRDVTEMLKSSSPLMASNNGVGGGLKSVSRGRSRRIWSCSSKYIDNAKWTFFLFSFFKYILFLSFTSFAGEDKEGGGYGRPRKGLWCDSPSESRKMNSFCSF